MSTESRLAMLSPAAQSLYRAGAFDPVPGGQAEHAELVRAGLIAQRWEPLDPAVHGDDAPAGVWTWAPVARIADGLDAFADACADAVDDHLEDLARDLEDGLAWGLDPRTRGISDRERAAGERGDSARVFGYLCGRAKLAQDAGAEGSDWTLDEILGT